MKCPTHLFTASNGVPFLCRIVPTRGRYGLEMALVNQQEPMIEFYDARYKFHYDFAGSKSEAIAAGAPCLGQFVTRYLVSTLQKSRIQPPAGLCLDGSIPEWRIDPDTMARVNAWMDNHTMPEHSGTPFNLAVRLTGNYNPGWSHLDEWYDIGECRIIAAAPRREDCDSYRQLQIVSVDAPGYRPRNVVRALHETMSFGCRCQHDCCGHFFGSPSRIRPLGNNRYAVLMSGHRNV